MKITYIILLIVNVIINIFACLVINSHINDAQIKIDKKLCVIDKKLAEIDKIAEQIEFIRKEIKYISINENEITKRIKDHNSNLLLHMRLQDNVNLSNP